MNKDLLVDGRLYISASRASKRVGYAPDYIGQLCRAGKVPGRLMGRTWYVELSSLLEHKKTRKLGKRKRNVILESARTNELQSLKKIPAELESAERSGVESAGRTFSNTASALNNFEISYEASAPEATPLPALTKKNDVPRVVRSRKNFVRTILPALATIMLIVSATLGTLGYFLPSQNVPMQNNFGEQVSRNGEISAASFLSWFGKIVGRDEDQGMLAADGDLGGQGIVVLPEPKDRIGVVTQIRRAFSDGVNIKIDDEKNTGVITPVFREGDDFENYAFVLVPVKDKDEENKTTN